MHSVRSQSQWLSRREAAEFLGISVSTLHEFARTGRGPKWHRPPGTRFARFAVQDLIDWMGAPIRTTAEARKRDGELSVI